MKESGEDEKKKIKIERNEIHTGKMDRNRK